MDDPKSVCGLGVFVNDELIPNEQKMDEKSQCNFVQVTEVMDFYKL